MFAIKCLTHSHFTPEYADFSAFSEIVVMGEFTDFMMGDDLPLTPDLVAYLADFLNDSYENADGHWLDERLFHIVGVQEVYGIITTDQPVLEIYRHFYQFDRLVDEHAFLDSYVFDDV